MATLWFVFVQMYIYALSYTEVSGTSKFVIAEFKASVACKLNQRLAAGCAKIQLGNYRGIVDCASKCEGGCKGFSLDTSHTCYTHQECPDEVMMGICEQMDQTFHMYDKVVPCRHKGIYNESADTCQCVGGWVGLHCERIPVSCKELALFGYNNPEIWVYIKTTNYAAPFKVLCSIFNKFTTTRLMQNLGKLQANRTWQDYVQGFYVDNNNFWIGLQKMKALNTKDLKILCLDTQFGPGYNLFTYRYNNFTLQDAVSGYNFTYSTSGKNGQGPEYIQHNSSFTSCLDNLKGVSFSTWDSDNDGDDQQNCAALTGSGWWYKNCTLPCSPLGSRNEWLSGVDLDLTNATYAESLMYFTTG